MKSILKCGQRSRSVLVLQRGVGKRTLRVLPSDVEGLRDGRARSNLVLQRVLRREHWSAFGEPKLKCDKGTEPSWCCDGGREVKLEVLLAGLMELWSVTVWEDTSVIMGNRKKARGASGTFTGVTMEDRKSLEARSAAMKGGDGRAEWGAIWWYCRG